MTPDEELLRSELDAAVEYHDHCGMLIESALGPEHHDHGGDRFHGFAKDIERLRLYFLKRPLEQKTMTPDEELAFLRANCKRLQAERDRLFQRTVHLSMLLNNQRIFAIESSVGRMQSPHTIDPDIATAIGEHDRYVLTGERPSWYSDLDEKKQIQQ